MKKDKNKKYNYMNKKRTKAKIQRRLLHLVTFPEMAKYNGILTCARSSSNRLRPQLLAVPQLCCRGSSRPGSRSSHAGTDDMLPGVRGSSAATCADVHSGRLLRCRRSLELTGLSHPVPCFGDLACE
ncbi:hypothetical protein CRENBAI_004784 [Crenichthys baileyi]|uniref:Uncharacterized protein n=1 Tax=Crenichthys baileyi TaxID=28760 RepID=A0AAV9R3F5_9TELE